MKQSFVMKALRSFKSCLQRQVNEAVRISATKVDVIVMNSRNEFHQAPIIRVVAATGLHASQGEDQAPVILAAGRRGGRGGMGGGSRGGPGRGSRGRGRRAPGIN